MYIFRRFDWQVNHKLRYIYLRNLTLPTLKCLPPFLTWNVLADTKLSYPSEKALWAIRKKIPKGFFFFAASFSTIYRGKVCRLTHFRTGRSQNRKKSLFMTNLKVLWFKLKHLVLQRSDLLEFLKKLENWRQYKWKTCVSVSTFQGFKGAP